VRTVWLRRPAEWPVALWTGPLPKGVSSSDHDAAFDEG
jgi:hypothetical protein